MDQERLDRALLSLEGLSIGDAFGQQFFMPHVAAEASRDNLPMPPWHYTDDTEMSLAVVQTLKECGSIDQDRLAHLFAVRFDAEPGRGYGAGARQLLSDINNGGDWKSLSHQMFGGSGSYGNGAAMRAAPIGAWFADDVDKTIEQTALSAEITHTHPEAVVGAIAVSLAANWVSALCSRGAAASELIPWIVSKIDSSEVRKRLKSVSSCPLDTWPFTIASEVGSGHDISAQDTVPFCLWMVAAFLDDYTEAMWTAARVGGDMDTTCAIIGGIIALAVGESGLPKTWSDHRERLSW